MNKKQRKALKIIRNLQKKMGETMDNSSELKSQTITTTNNYWVATWANASASDMVLIGVDFERRKNGK